MPSDLSGSKSSTTNDAAERLRTWIEDGNEIASVQATGLVLLDAALAAERRATVERIRAAVVTLTPPDPEYVYPGWGVAMMGVEGILNAEAER